STIRLKVIAAERAPNIATVIHTICCQVGSPFAASTAPKNANGNANSVCSNLIIASVVRSFSKKELISCLQSEHEFYQMTDSKLNWQLGTDNCKLEKLLRRRNAQRPNTRRRYLSARRPGRSRGVCAHSGCRV